jgi:hypothetical protein
VVQISPKNNWLAAGHFATTLPKTLRGGKNYLKRYITIYSPIPTSRTFAFNVLMISSLSRVMKQNKLYQNI